MISFLNNKVVIRKPSEVPTWRHGHDVTNSWYTRKRASTTSSRQHYKYRPNERKTSNYVSRVAINYRIAQLAVTWRRPRRQASVIVRLRHRLNPGRVSAVRPEGLAVHGVGHCDHRSCVITVTSLVTERHNRLLYCTRRTILAIPSREVTDLDGTPTVTYVVRSDRLEAKVTSRPRDVTSSNLKYESS